MSVQVGCTQSPFWLIPPELPQLYREDSKTQLSAPLNWGILLWKDLWIPHSQKKCQLDPHCNSLCSASASSQRLQTFLCNLPFFHTSFLITATSPMAHISSRLCFRKPISILFHLNLLTSQNQWSCSEQQYPARPAFVDIHTHTHT